MPLRDLTLKRYYRSHVDDLLPDFYRPCLGEATRYSRAVGYFSGAALGLAAQGIEGFVRAGGSMRIVASPELLARDSELIEAGYAHRERLISETVATRLLVDPLSDPLHRQLGLLGWLIARNRLDIKLAVVEREGRAGIYHEKVGIFEDDTGDRVVFHGSANESHGGLVANFESLMVFRSWLAADEADVAEFSESFELLWSDETDNLSLYPFPEAARRELIKLAPERIEGPASDETTHTPAGSVGPGSEDETLPEPRRPQMPEDVELRDYQRAALRGWFKNNGQGVLAMATGTGKTLTALAAVTRLFGAVDGKNGTMICVIVCPYQHLVEQWAADARRFGLDPVLCYRSRARWQAPLTAAVRAVNRGVAPIHLAIATNSTFQTETFQRALEDCPGQSLLIADEVHNLGAESAREGLPEGFRYRLGLSATPERHMDPEGTDALQDYFGEVVFEFGLADALDVGALTPYEYAVSIVELEGEELDQYLDLTRRIGAAIGGAGLDSPAAQILLIARARIVANARNKLEALREAIQPHADEAYQLVYCGDGSISHDTGVAASRQIELVVRLLGIELGIRTHPYTAETPVEERERLRKRFASGELQSLVAIRCLDEGVDIPATRRAYILASSKNPRQYIQRRGRVLRPSPDTGKDRAFIHDFLAIPPADAVDDSIWETERKLVAGELERVVGFAGLALNGPAAMDSLQDLRSRYDLHHV